jgi:hypothetical protein
MLLLSRKELMRSRGWGVLVFLTGSLIIKKLCGGIYVFLNLNK